MSLREDQRQWLIYQPEPVTAVVGGVQAFASLFGAGMMKLHENESVRAMGHAVERIAQTQLSHWRGELKNLEPTEAQRTMAEYLQQVGEFLEGKTEAPAEALDEIHAALVWIDKRARGAGVSGDGWYRLIVRESNIGR